MDKYEMPFGGKFPMIPGYFPHPSMRNARMPRPPFIPPEFDRMNAMPIDEAQEKVVKDQNFLNSDDKLFDSLVDNELSLRNIFENTVISKKLSGRTLFRAVKKLIYDAEVVLFDSEERKPNENIKTLDMLKTVISEYLNSKNSMSYASSEEDWFDDCSEFRVKILDGLRNACDIK